MISLLLRSEDGLLLKTENVIRETGGGLTILVFPKGGKTKRPNLCDCDCCDLACDCPANAECFHHADGEGGLCVSAGGKRLAVFDSSLLIRNLSCSCKNLQLTEGLDVFSLCPHMELLRDEWEIAQPGPPRQAGSQAARKRQRDEQRALLSLLPPEEGETTLQTEDSSLLN